MGLLSFVALFAFTSLIALEGFSTDFQKNQIAQATSLINLVGKAAEVDVSAVLPHFVHLKYVAISALAVVVLRFYGFFVALYLILTRGLTIFSLWNKIYPVLITADINKLAVNHLTELTTILTSVGFIAYFLSCISFGSTRPRAPKTASSQAPKAAKAEQKAGKR